MLRKKIANIQYCEWSFPGGIHPPENKSSSNHQAIRQAQIPTQLVYPLKQHQGSAAIPCVKAGEYVYKNQMIAVGEGPISASIHAASSGYIGSIGEHPVQHASGSKAMSIVIDTDGHDLYANNSELEAFKRDALSSETPASILRRIKSAGITGLGGASFPTDVKLAKPANEPAYNLLVFNGVECEPYISCDDRLMRERSLEILLGCEAIAYCIGVDHILIGIEDNKPEAISAMQDALEQLISDSSSSLQNYRIQFEIKAVPTKYPSGGEKQLVQLLTGKEIPHGKLPSSIGIICQNVGTAYAVYQCLYEAQALISRIVTITGEGLAPQHRGNYEVRIGTRVKDLLESLNTDWQSVTQIIMGGPLMGETINSAHVPIIKSSNCIIAATAEEIPEAPAEQACIRCGHCEQVCPASLLPQQLYWHAKNDQLSHLEKLNLMDCIECGACAYVCPSHIPLVQYYRYGKGKLKAHERDTKKSDLARQRFESRKERIEAEKKARELARENKKQNADMLRQANLNGQGASKTEHNTVEETNKQNLSTTSTVMSLKNQYSKLNKKWKDAKKALEHQKKHQVDSDQLQVFEEKVKKLEHDMLNAKNTWDQAAQAAATQAAATQAAATQTTGINGTGNTVADSADEENAAEDNAKNNRKERP